MFAVYIKRIVLCFKLFFPNIMSSHERARTFDESDTKIEKFDRKYTTKYNGTFTSQHLRTRCSLIIALQNSIFVRAYML